MSQIRSRFDIKNTFDNKLASGKMSMPSFFDETDEISKFKGIAYSVALHIAFIILAVCMQSFVFIHLPKPELPTRDIEFKLVQNEEQPPINKNTKIRADKNSKAGGKHNPKRPVSQPTNAAKKQVKKQQSKAVQQKQKSPAKVKQPLMDKVAQNIQKVQKQAQTQPVKQSAKQPVKQVAKQPVKTTVQAPVKPTKVSAPSAVKPTLKPAISPKGYTNPTTPKVAVAPSPFKVAAPSSNAPVGTSYKPQGTSSGSSASGTSKTGAPAPKFSTSGGASGGTYGGSKGASSGSSGSKGSSGSYASRGSSGNVGNPGAGNPNGTPGIDAIRQPNWGPYMRDLERKIKGYWTPPKGDSSKRVVITFVIARDGRLLSHRVVKSSGVPLADKAAMSAIELAAPFRPLPAEFKGQSVPIEFTFDYNVLNSILK